MNIILVFAFQNAGIMKYFLSKDDLPIFYLLLQATVKYNQSWVQWECFVLYFEYVKCKERRVVDRMHPR